MPSAVAERLITTAGFEPVQGADVCDTARGEVFADFHYFADVNGRALTVDEAGLLWDWGRPEGLVRTP